MLEFIKISHEDQKDITKIIIPLNRKTMNKVNYSLFLVKYYYFSYFFKLFGSLS